MSFYKIIPMICLALLVACNENTGQNNDTDCNQQVKSINQPKRDVTEIKQEVRSGDIESYKELRIAYLDYPLENFLFWALLMANKYDYPPAYLDVFYALVDSYGADIETFREIDKRTQELALEYLTIASEKGVKEADEILLQIKN